MALAPRRHQVLSGAVINSNNNSGTLQNLSRNLNPTIVAFLDVQGAVTGTSPNLTVTVYGWTGSNRPAQLAQFTAVTATLTAPQRIVIHDVLEEHIQVAWAVTGAGATFNNTSVDLLMTAPDA